MFGSIQNRPVAPVNKHRGHWLRWGPSEEGTFPHLICEPLNSDRDGVSIYEACSTRVVSEGASWLALTSGGSQERSYTRRNLLSRPQAGHSTWGSCPTCGGASIHHDKEVAIDENDKQDQMVAEPSLGRPGSRRPVANCSISPAQMAQYPESIYCAGSERCCAEMASGNPRIPCGLEPKAVE